MLLNWCQILSSLGSCKLKRWTHSFTSHSTLHNTILASNISIARHAKAGDLDFARHLFDQMPARTVVSWNAMITAYSRWGWHGEAFFLASHMHRSSVHLNDATFSSLLSACARSQSLRAGKQLHCLVLKSGSEDFHLVGSALLHFYLHCFEILEGRRVFEVLHTRNELLWSLLVVGYVHCDLMAEALDVFSRMPNRDVAAWTAVISGYSKMEDGCERALKLFGSMREEGEVRPNEFTFDCVLRVSGRLGVLQEGRSVHGLLMTHGFDADRSISHALVEFYCNCEAIEDAERVCAKMVNPCLDALNSLIGGLVEMGRMEDAESIFSRLTEPDTVSYNLMIKAYAVSDRIKDSERMFLKIPQRSITSSNAMITLYSKHGEMDKASKLFENTKAEGDPVTWNAMLTAYIQYNQHEEVLRLYINMRRSSVGETRSTFASVLHACSCLGSLQQGQLLHSHLVKTPFESNVYVGTSLIDMYSKCGSILDAHKSFVSISSPNVVAWTALISSYAHHGLGSKALSVFKDMLEQGANPNASTFVGILSACSRAGLVDDGMRLLSLMENRFGVKPSLEHYACAVELLGRAGCLSEAEELIREMPVEADGIIWGALLRSCWFWMDIELGERVAEKILELDSRQTSAYVIMSNIYANLGRWEKKMDWRQRLKTLDVQKDHGYSWLELKDSVHVFSVEDKAHPDCNIIYRTLKHLAKNVNISLQYGYASC